MGKFNGRAKCLAVILGAGCAVAGAMAQSLDELATQQLRRAQEREAQQRERLEPHPDVRLPAPEQAPTRTLPLDKAPCFPIHRLELEGDASEQFGWLKNEANGHAQLDEPDPALGRCLGAQGIQVVIQRLQHALIARGFVTTRVLAGAQNLQQRAPTAEADIRIAPGREPVTSPECLTEQPVACNRVAIAGGEIAAGEALGPAGLGVIGTASTRDCQHRIRGRPDGIDWRLLARGRDANSI